MTATESAKASAKGQKESSKTPNHPPYSSMIKQAVRALKGTHPKGVSRKAIAKYLQEHFTLPGNFNTQLNKSLQTLVTKGKLVQVKDSFREPAVTKHKAAGSTKAPARKKAGAAKPASSKATKANKQAEQSPGKKSDTKAATGTKTRATSGRSTKAATKPSSSPSKAKATTAKSGSPAKKSASKEKATQPTGGVTKRQQATGKAKSGRTSSRLT